MADPLSIAASIAGLLSLAGSIIPKGYALCSKIKRRAEDVRILMNEVTGLSGLLFGLQAHVTSEASGPNSPTLNGLLGNNGTSWKDVARDCRRLLSEIASLLDDISKEKPARLLIHKDFITDRAGELVSRVERYKTFFILCFQVENESVKPLSPNDETVQKISKTQLKTEGYRNGQSP